MALAGSCGTLRGVVNADINSARSAIFTPCDLPFARDGIAAEAEWNVEQIIFADLDMARLDWARREGAVRNWEDRRPDLYASIWKGA
jgi:predicted amidohydrolase